MTVEEAKKALEQFRAQIKSEGYTDEEEIDRQIIATLGGMFVEGEIDVNQLDELMGLVGEGYHLSDDFLAMSTEDQKANFFDEDENGENEYSDDDVEKIEKEVTGKDKSGSNENGSDNNKKDVDGETEEEERKRADKLFGM